MTYSQHKIQFIKKRIQISNKISRPESINQINHDETNMEIIVNQFSNRLITNRIIQTLKNG